MSDPRNYGDEDVRAILERALAEPGNEAAGLSHEQLLAIGSEVGLTPEAIDQAARAIEEARLDGQARSTIRRARRRPLVAHALAFTAINGALFAVNAFSTPGEWWVLFSIFFWGLVLGLHAALAFGVPVSPAQLTRARQKLERAPTRLRVAAPPTAVTVAAPPAAVTVAAPPAAATVAGESAFDELGPPREHSPQRKLS